MAGHLFKGLTSFLPCSPLITDQLSCCNDSPVRVGPRFVMSPFEDQPRLPVMNVVSPLDEIAGALFSRSRERLSPFIYIEETHRRALR